MFMNTEELECHLVELKSKSMETRGILRKLIQEYSRLGNVDKVETLRSEFKLAGYEESSGMKSSIMYSYVQGRNLKLALNEYRILNEEHSNFKLDDFKIIDLATLMVKNRMVDEAMELVRNETKTRYARFSQLYQHYFWFL